MKANKHAGALQYSVCVQLFSQIICKNERGLYNTNIYGNLMTGYTNIGGSETAVTGIVLNIRGIGFVL